LPHKLVEAFRATLSEAADADLLLHVVDTASPLLHEQRLEVDRVLDSIGAGAIPQILVCNKIDRLGAEALPRVLADSVPGAGGTSIPRVFVSALTGTGLGELRRLITEVASRGVHNPAAAGVSTPDDTAACLHTA
jgi:GTP-binding protein HflX